MGIISENAIQVLKQRYFREGEDWDGLCRRVVSAILPEGKQREAFDQIYTRKFLPNTPALVNAGRDKQMLFACFVLPIDDSMESIFDSVKNAALVHKYGGGCISGDSLLVTDDGVVRMKEFVLNESSSKVLSYNENTNEMGYSCVEGKYRYHFDKDDYLEIYCSFGVEHKATNWHPFYVFDGEKIVSKRADEISIGDAIIGSNLLSEAEIERDDDSWAIGFIISDASVENISSDRNSRIRATKSYEEPIKRLAEIYKTNYKISSDSRYAVPVWETSICGDDAYKICAEFGENRLNYSKRVIPRLLKGTPTQKINLIAGLLDGDGYYNKSKYNYEYSTVSKGLANDIIFICGELGIKTKVRERSPRNKRWKTLYEITIYNNPILDLFMKGLSCRHTNNPYHYKKDAIKANIAPWEKFILSREGTTVLERRHHKSGYPLLCTRANFSIWKQKGIVPISILAAILWENGNKKLACSLNSASIVKAIKRPSQDCHLYDLTVTPNNNYVAGVNGFSIVHNTGFSFGRLREKGAPVKSTRGESSGVVSFMEVFNAATNSVKQGGVRRGANLAVLPIHHPEIVDFIKCKEDTSKLTNFNISVGITEAFMLALEDKSTFDLISPVNKEAVKTVDPRELFDLLVEQMHATGEPGIIFLDNINEYNPNINLGDIETCNPCGESPLLPYESCLAFDTLIVLEDGVRKIGESTTRANQHIHTDGFRKFESISYKKHDSTVIIKFNNGLEIETTADHKFILPSGENKQAIDLLEGEAVIMNNEFPFAFKRCVSERHEMFGWMHGDGWFSKTVGISFNYKDGDLPMKEKFLPLFQEEFTCDRKPLYDDNDRHQVQTERQDAIQRANELGFIKGIAREKQLPITFYSWSDVEQRSFVRGLFTADSSVAGKEKTQIHFVSNSIKLVNQLQQYLQCIGIKTNRYTTVFKDKNRYPQYKLAITCDSAKRYMKYIGFVEGSRKNADFNYNGQNYTDSDILVSSVMSSWETVPVYDVNNVDTTNTFYANGILVHNCVLGSIDVAKFYNEEIEDIDYIAMGNTVDVAVEFLDTMIDKNHYTLPEIEDATKKTRKIGLGIMGWADLLYQLRIPYDSKEAITLAEDVMCFITDKAMLKSIDIGMEEGCYPELGNAELSVHRRFLHSDYYQEDIGHLRNAFVTIIAPTGSLSIIADTSSGIEPNFALAYTRRTDTGLELKYVNKYLEEALKEVDMFNEDIINKIVAQGSVQNIWGMPDWIKRTFVTAHDINPEWHISMQAAFQRYTTGSISKTINMPSHATKDDVKKAVLLAWKEKCKGMTVYRDGCRPNQILTTNADKKVEGEPRNRPHTTAGTTTKIPTACGNLYVTINRDEKGICEVFAQMGKGGNCAAAQLEAIARLISLNLRSGISMESNIKQLSNIKCSETVWHNGYKVCSCADAIALAFKEQLSNGTEPKTEKQETETKRRNIMICPDCETNVSIEEGCAKCHNCGWSKC